MGTSQAQPLKRETEFVWFRTIQRAGTDGTLHKKIFGVTAPCHTSVGFLFSQVSASCPSEGSVRHRSSIYFGWCQTGLYNIFAVWGAGSVMILQCFQLAVALKRGSSQCELELQNWGGKQVTGDDTPGFEAVLCSSTAGLA